MINISCIGSGTMGFILMKSVSSSASGIRIFFTDADSEKAESSAYSLEAEALQSNDEAVRKGNYVFLAVKPQVLPKVLAEITDAARDRFNSGDPPVFVSMAAGWSIKKIQQIIGVKLPVVRIMPNIPALISKGMIAMSASPEVPPEKIAELKVFLGGAGIIDTLEEHYMDAVTGLSGSGPAFVYLFIEALADGGVRAGLPREKALRYAAQTVLGSAAMIHETKKHPGELKDMVTSPGGTTIAGIAALEERAFRSTVIKAVEAAWIRSMELSESEII